MSYIEREALRDALYEADAITMKGIAIINQFPTADVAPIVRGEWEKYLTYWYECPICKFNIHEQFLLSCKYHYCPNCGCKMDGGEKHE